MAATTDWEAVERDYRAGLLSVREIGLAHGVSHTAINKRAKKHGWDRDLKGKIRAKAEIRLSEVDELESPGFVYVIYIDTGSEQFYKIGLAKHFSSRLSTHQCSSPFEMLVACCYFVPNMRHEERALHSIYSGQRVRGEWFRLSHEDLGAISLRSLLV